MLSITQIILLLVSLPYYLVTGANDGLTSDDGSRFVAVDPELRLTLVGTPETISASALASIEKALSTFATNALKKRYSSTPFEFEEVVLKAYDEIDTLGLGSGRRVEYTVEEVEDEEEISDLTDNVNLKLLTRRSLRKPSHLESNTVGYGEDQLTNNSKERLMQDKFSQGIILYGNVTFVNPDLVPPSTEANGSLLRNMEDSEGIKQAILDEGNAELADIESANIKIWVPGAPSAAPSSTPSSAPSESPSHNPSQNPSESPSLIPSAQPSVSPSFTPSQFPSRTPSSTPSQVPSGNPSDSPTITRSDSPSETPSLIPSEAPTITHSEAPTQFPSEMPSQNPTESPSLRPSRFPSSSPSMAPSMMPSQTPSDWPSSGPSSLPTQNPSVSPTNSPSESPTISREPSQQPSQQPSLYPTVTQSPTISPEPSERPTDVPSIEPTNFPTNVPSINPTTSVPPTTPSVISQPTVKANDLGSGETIETGTPLNVPVIVGVTLSAVFIIAGSIWYIKRRRNANSPNGGLAKDDDENTPRKLILDDFSPIYGSPPSGAPTPTSGVSSESPVSSLEVDLEMGSPDVTTSSANTIPGINDLTMSSATTMQTDNKTNRNNVTSPTGSSVGFPIKVPENKDLDNNFRSDEIGFSPKSPEMDNGFCGMGGLDTLDSAFGIAGAKFEATPTREKKGIDPKASPSVLAGSSPIPRDPSLDSKVSPAIIPLAAGGKKRSPSPNSRRDLKSSPITSITPSKVSKEEFEEDWDVDLPYNWNPESETKSGKNLNNQSDSDEDDYQDGSFPSLSPPTTTAARGLTDSFGFRSDSSAYQTGNESGDDGHPMDWSNKDSEYDGTSVEDSSKGTWDEYGEKEQKRKNANDSADRSAMYFTPNGTPEMAINTPDRNRDNQSSPGASLRSSFTGESSQGSSSKQLINDLVWLEKKIADVRARVNRLDGEEELHPSPPMTPSSYNDSPGRSSVGSPIASNIECRDCLAPPGKLHIVINSTKDGPTIHDIRPGSCLEGQLSKGDLLVAVDDVDTRSFTAEAVMEMMVARSSHQRKLTVLHFEDTTEDI